MKRLWIWPLVMLFATGVLLAPAWGQVPGIRITPVLQTSTTLSGQSLQFPLFRNQVTSLLVEIAPGGENTRHQHPVPNLIYVLEGSVTIDTEGVGQRTFTAGQVFIEPVNQWHRAFNSGTVVHRAVAVFSGEAGKSNFGAPAWSNSHRGQVHDNPADDDYRDRAADHVSGLSQRDHCLSSGNLRPEQSILATCILSTSSYTF